MGAVWLAEARGPGRFVKRVILKFIQPHLVNSASIVERFEREARVAALLHHPNIVQTFAFERTPEGVTFLVMEYVPGKTLRQLAPLYLKNPSLRPVGPWLRIFAMLSDGLACAHEITDESGRALGLVHRDLAPGNVIISEHNIPRILDFGVAHVEDEHDETQPGTFVGHLSYASPEQCLGAPITPASDVFTLGIQLYRILTGKHPFQSRGRIDTLRQIIAAEPLSVLSHRPDLHPAVVKVVEGCLERSASERIQNGGELRDALIEALERAKLNVDETRARQFAAKLLALDSGSLPSGSKSGLKSTSKAGLPPKPFTALTPSSTSSGSEPASATPSDLDSQSHDEDAKLNESSRAEQLLEEGVTKISVDSFHVEAQAAPKATGAAESAPSSSRPKLLLSGVATLMIGAGVFFILGPNLRSTERQPPTSTAEEIYHSIKDVQVDSTQLDAAKPDAVKPDAVKPDAVKPDAVKPDAKLRQQINRSKHQKKRGAQRTLTQPRRVHVPLKAEPSKAEPPKAEPSKAEPPKAEPPKAEPPKVTLSPWGKAAYATAYSRPEITGVLALIERQLGKRLKTKKLAGVTRPLAREYLNNHNPGSPVRIPLQMIYEHAGRAHLAGRSPHSIAKELLMMRRSGVF